MAKAEQSQLIETEPIVPGPVKAAAKKYLTVLTERMLIMEQEPDLRQGLIDLMEHHAVTTVRVGNQTVTLEKKSKLATKTDKAEEA